MHCSWGACDGQATPEFIHASLRITAQQGLQATVAQVQRRAGKLTSCYKQADNELRVL